MTQELPAVAGETIDAPPPPAPVETLELAPVAEAQRIDVLDVLRGFALIGILLMNIEWFNRPIAVLTMADYSLTGLDHAAAAFVKIFVEGKFYKLFSLLFGMGFAVMLLRAESLNRPFFGWFTRRAAALFLFGMAHSILLWTGDILHDYAFAAMMLLGLVWLRRGGPGGSLFWAAFVPLSFGAGAAAYFWHPGGLIGGGICAVVGIVLVLLRRHDKFAWLRNTRWILKLAIILALPPIVFPSLGMAWKALSDDPSEARTRYETNQADLQRLAAEWPAREQKALAAAALIPPGQVGEFPEEADEDATPDKDGLAAGKDDKAVDGDSATADTIVAGEPVKAAATDTDDTPAGTAGDAAADAAAAAAAVAAETGEPALAVAGFEQDDAAADVAAGAGAAPGKSGDADRTKDAAKQDKKKEKSGAERWYEFREWRTQMMFWERQAMTHPSYAVATQFRWKSSIDSVWGAPFFALGLLHVFLFGWWLVEASIIRDAERHLGLFRNITLIGWVFGFAFAVSGVGHLYMPEWELGPNPGAMSHILAWSGQVLLCAAYVGSFVLLLRKAFFKRALGWLAPLGRMALTNYLTHSLVFSTLFYGYGAGWFGQVSRFPQMGLVLAMITTQVIVSRVWLAHFHYGPMEWLWRSATYLKWQPLRR